MSERWFGWCNVLQGGCSLIDNCRYTLTYTPSADRILPAPQQLHVKIRNTSAIPLRAAYLHGPYTLYVACYPSTFDPNKKHENHKQEGSPDFEPNLKAGGQWSSKLSVPEEIRDAAGSAPSRQSLDGNARSFSWIIEIASQVIFSTGAAVHFEVLVGRDERSIELGFYPNAASEQGGPGKLEDYMKDRTAESTQAKGVYSKAMRLAVDDTKSLWDTPAFPTWDGQDDGSNSTHTKEQVLDDGQDEQQKQNRPSRKKQKVHLVVVTHGIHSNIGADMLFLKESIDATAKYARKDARVRKTEMKAENSKRDKETSGNSTSSSTPEIDSAPGTNPSQDEPDGKDDDEQVIVRGFAENVIRTERGIQYLGKRLAKYVLSITYPDQPFLPVKSSISKTIARTLTGQKSAGGESQSAQKNSSVYRDEEHTNDNLAYQITSISFVGHSLGGLTQTYAIAYIQKHSPEFFEKIKPINFIAMASPFLGLSNENPIYVKFALDFGLVGRTGQDLGLSWRTPTMIRSGWGTMIGGLGTEAQKSKAGPDPGAKPLLRILPTGPAHAALKLFRNRSLYSNVVNDGIVPLRTSCLLFLDWKGLGRVEKARRDNGIVGTMVGWGWAEMTGQNASSPKTTRPWGDLFHDSGEESDTKKASRRRKQEDDVPQPSSTALTEDNTSGHNVPVEPKSHQFLAGQPPEDEAQGQQNVKQASSAQSSTVWSGFLSLFKPQASAKSPRRPPKNTKIYRRSQTTGSSQDTDSDSTDNSDMPSPSRRPMVRGPSLYSTDATNENMEAPPKTTFFESAGDLLKPPLPCKEFLIDPASRPRTIFHDRIYHPEDIPAPQLKQSRSKVRRSISRDVVPKSPTTQSSQLSVNTDNLHLPISNSNMSDMKIEEKIARAYHHDLSWRKVLVRLEPDAHNNMIVRRMFSNAYGWPVIKHMCDTHFGYTASAVMEDALETNVDRTIGTQDQAGRSGEHVQGQTDPPDIDKERDSGRDAGPEKNSGEGYPLTKKMTTPDIDRLIGPPKRTNSEIREASDEVPDLSVTSPTAEKSMSSSGVKANPPNWLSRRDSARWSDRFFDGSDDDSDVDYLMSPLSAGRGSEDFTAPRETSDADLAKILGHSTPSQASPKPLITDKFTSPPRPLRSRDGEPKPSNLKEDAVMLDSSTSGLSGVGLGKSVEEQISPRRERRNSIPEQVALAKAEEERQKQND